VKLKKTILGLPVHQDLSEKHMERILEVLRALAGKRLF
jgi:hypothetical protein